LTALRHISAKNTVRQDIINIGRKMQI